MPTLTASDYLKKYGEGSEVEKPKAKPKINNTSLPNLNKNEDIPTIEAIAKEFTEDKEKNVKKKKKLLYRNFKGYLSKVYNNYIN